MSVDDILSDLRPLEAFPVEEGGVRCVGLADPTGYAPDMVTVSTAAFSLLTLRGQADTAAKLAVAYEEQYGAPLDPEQIVHLFARLDEALLLDSPRFAAHRARIREAFAAAPVRPAVLAGTSYPAEPEELAATIDALMAATGPGARDADLTAALAPHIDFRVGADLMAAAWRRIVDARPDRIVILGVGHMLSDDFFACVDKDFVTPIGTMPVDREFLARLKENFGEDIYGQADVHRSEHSVEFPALFFSRLMADRPGVTAVPILLSFPENIDDIDHPLFNARRIDRFAAALKNTVADADGKTIYLASVDFSHVGARFGDVDPLTDRRLTDIETDDARLIDALADGARGPFMAAINETNAVNRVCGFPALYTLFSLLDDFSGERIGYRQNLEGEGSTMVSFASMALYRRR